MSSNNLFAGSINQSSISPQAVQSVQDYLAQFAAKDDFESLIESIFGTKIGADAIRQQWLSGDFSLIPTIEVLSNGELGTANGAYAASLDSPSGTLRERIFRFFGTASERCCCGFGVVVRRNRA
jgi:hypothetical protein